LVIPQVILAAGIEIGRRWCYVEDIFRAKGRRYIRYLKEGGK